MFAGEKSVLPHDYWYSIDERCSIESQYLSQRKTHSIRPQQQYVTYSIVEIPRNDRCQTPKHQITSPAALAELAYSARAAARHPSSYASRAPYSEREGSLTVSEDYGQTFVLLSLLAKHSYVYWRHYLTTSRRLCACFTKHPAPRPRPQQPGVIAIVYSQPT